MRNFNNWLKFPFKAVEKVLNPHFSDFYSRKLQNYKWLILKIIKVFLYLNLKSKKIGIKEFRQQEIWEPYCLYRSEIIAKISLGVWISPPPSTYS